MTPLARAGASVRQLVLVVAALCLLGTGAVELTPRAGSALAATSAAHGPAVGGASSAGRATPSRPAAESSAPSSALTLRAAFAAAAPSGGGTAAAPPGSSPLVAPHLIARPVARPPAPSYVLAVPGGPTERAPPVPAGT